MTVERKPGTAHVKEHYKWVRPVVEQPAGEEATGKKPKNLKKRIRSLATDAICNAIAQNRECPFGDKCKHSHDLEAFLRSKEDDLEGPCPVREAYGRCHYGWKCRFANAHRAENSTPAPAKEEEEDKAGPFKSMETREIQKAIRQRSLQTPRTDKVMKAIQQNQQRRQEKHTKDFPGDVDAGVRVSTSLAALPPVTPVLVDGDTTLPVPEVSETKEEAKQDPKMGSAEDYLELSPAMAVPNLVASEGKEDTLEQVESEPQQKEHALEKEEELVTKEAEGAALDVPTKDAKRSLPDLRGKLYLAPLTTVGNLPFRKVCTDFGADLTCSEMALADELMKGKGSEWALLRRWEGEATFGAQICGSRPDTLARTAEIIGDHVDFVDLNMGCPIDMVFEKGMGSGLFNRPNRMFDTIQAMRAATDAPLSLKFRTGVYEKNPRVAHQHLERYCEMGANLLTLHGRTRQQRYTRLADWDYIRDCAHVVKKWREENEQERNVFFFGSISFDLFLTRKEQDFDAKD